MIYFAPIKHPFVGRQNELALYDQLLTNATYWLLIVTGQGGMGKSALLKEFARRTPQHTLPLRVNFATETLRTDALAILEELAWQLKPSVAARQYAAFQRELKAGHEKLAAIGAELRAINQELHAYAQSVVTGTQSTISMNIQEQRRETVKLVATAFYAMLLTMQQEHLVLLFDTCEWLAEPELAEVGQWVLNELLPSMHDRLQQRRKLCMAVLTSRMRLPVTAIEREQRYAVPLSFLDQPAVNAYLEQVGMAEEPALRQRIYEITRGHALCVSIIATLWQERGQQAFTLADFPALLEQYSERALLEFIQERLDQRLRSPFRELTRYGVILRSFNLPMLRAVFPDLLPEDKAMAYFEQFIRYPYIEFLGAGRYAIHNLLRELCAAHIREQEPERWLQLHERALAHLKNVSPQSPDCYYHEIACNEEQGMSVWGDAMENARSFGTYEQCGALLQVLGDKALVLSPWAEAQGIYQQGRVFCRWLEQIQEALESYGQALQLFRKVGERLGEAHTKARGKLQQFQRETVEVLELYEQELKLFRKRGDQLGEANTLKTLGELQQLRKETEEEEESYGRALQLFRKGGDRLGEINTKMVGVVQRFKEKMYIVLNSYEESFAVKNHDIDEKNIEELGKLQQFQREMEEVLESYGETMYSVRKMGEKMGENRDVKELEGLQQLQREMEEVLESYGQALQQYRQMGDHLGETDIRRALRDGQ